MQENIHTLISISEKEILHEYCSSNAISGCRNMALYRVVFDLNINKELNLRRKAVLKYCEECKNKCVKKYGSM